MPASRSQSKTEKKYKLEGASLEDFKKALKALADAAPADARAAHAGDTFLTYRELYNEVAAQTKFGKKFTRAVEAVCNDTDVAPQSFFNGYYAEANRCHEWKKRGIHPFKPATR